MDIPISSGVSDKFGRVGFAKAIARKIKSNYNHNSSLAIGIDGPWGSGKTSFIRLIKEQIQADNGARNRVLIDFHPWKSNNSQQIIFDFFEAITQEISKVSPDVSRELDKYVSALIKVDGSYLSKVLSPLTKLVDQNKALEDRYNTINQKLTQINKQIIVFIDDVDRLDQQEIIEVLRLIRNTASFRNTVFVVAYEREYLVSAISGHNWHKPDKYLEKIFQFEFPLPYFEDIILRKELLIRIDPYLLDEHRELFKETILTDGGLSGRGHAKLFKEHIRTFRDIVRYTNAFLFDYDFIKDEINIEDLALIELLKIKYPDIYDLLYEKQDDFLTLKKSSNYEEASRLILKLNKEKGENQDKSKLAIIEYIEHCHDTIYSDCEIEEIVYLLRLVFDKKREKDAKSITIADNFYKYFTGRVFMGEISIADFEKSRQKPYDEFIKDIDLWIEKDFISDLTIRFGRVGLTELANSVEYQKFIKAMFHFGSRTAIAGTKYLINTDRLYRFLNHTPGSGFIESMYGGHFEEHVKFIKEIFDNAQEPYVFESWVLRIIKDRYDSEFVLTPGKIEKFQLDYFKKYLTTDKGFSDAFWSFAHDCKIIGRKSISGTTFQTITKPNPKATKLILEYIDRNNLLDQFIQRIIRVDTFNGKVFGFSTVVGDAIFSNMDEFESFLKDQLETNSNSKYIKEFYEFFLKIKARGFQYVDFDFKDIPPPTER